MSKTSKFQPASEQNMASSRSMTPAQRGELIDELHAAFDIIDESLDHIDQSFFDAQN